MGRVISSKNERIFFLEKGRSIGAGVGGAENNGLF
jgi:hypothetical protein